MVTSPRYWTQKVVELNQQKQTKHKKVEEKIWDFYLLSDLFLYGLFQ